jgi:uncharacterized protein YmfQ (DUF2313 family)
MGSFGGWSFAGGTACFGGSEDAEERWYHLWLRWLGDGAYTTDDDDPRSRILASLSEGHATMESEGIKAAMEAVPCTAIDALDEWEKAHGAEFIADVFRTYMRRQNAQQSIMEMALSTAHPRRIERLVRQFLEDASCYVFENTGATIDSVDGVRYWCVLVPDKYAMPEYRTLWRALERLLARWAPAHTEFTICTVEDLAGGDPMFYLDGYFGTACGKDCPSG